MEKTLLVTIKLNTERDNWRLKDIAVELQELARTGGAEVTNNISCMIDKPTPNFFIGRGKTEEIAAICEYEKIDTVIFSHDLSGTQQRNLEEVIGRKTVDRTQLILDIFARHARSPEGKTQVELAQLQYLIPRLVGKGIMLSQLGAGIGTRGPGEQKLEVDRRKVRRRIEKLREDLGHYISHRVTLRKKRKENAIPSVTLVGYTNAGKSTLLNALTDADQLVRDSLFTTLDSLSKSLHLPNGENTIVTDTVGFLHNLPHQLVEAFKATLEDVAESDLLIHVLDASHPKVYEHSEAVFSVLRELQADKKPIITALNKIDLLEDKIWLAELKADFVNSVTISAKFKENLDILLAEVQKVFSDRLIQVQLIIPQNRMDLISLLYREGKVKEVKYLKDVMKCKVTLAKVLYLKLLHNNEIKEVD